MLWNRKTGQPVHHAIVWQDRRAEPTCAQLREQGLGPLIQSKTGLIIDAYFSGTKLKWLLDHVPQAREQAQRGELAFGTVDSWLLWQLTEGALHATDVTNASRTMLFNVRKNEWDARVARAAGHPDRAHAQGAALQRALTAKPGRRCWVRRSRSAASPATSRARCSARPASRKAWPRTPMARAASC